MCIRDSANGNPVGYNVPEQEELNGGFMLDASIEKIKLYSRQSAEYDIWAMPVSYTHLDVYKRQSKPFNEASTSESFCSIIGTQGMEVDFTVLESELPLIKRCV